MIIDSNKKCVFEKSDEGRYFVVHYYPKGPTIIRYMLDVSDNYVSYRSGTAMGEWYFSVEVNGIRRERDVHEASPLEILLFMGSDVEPNKMFTQEDREELNKRKEEVFKGIQRGRVMCDLFTQMHSCFASLREIREKSNQKEVSREQFIIYRSMHKNKTKCIDRIVKRIEKEVKRKW